MPRRAFSGHPDYTYVYEWPDDIAIPDPPMGVSEFQPTAFMDTDPPSYSVAWWKRWLGRAK